MKTLKGDSVFLRALEPSDLDNLFALENDEDVWEISNTSTPFSHFVLTQYLDNAHRDIYDVRQLRLVICISETQNTIGFIDLFDFEPKHKRVGIGIIIFDKSERNKGFAKQSLELLCNYAFTHLNVHQVFANISEDNINSIKLFESIGFNLIGVKKDWIFSEGKFKDEMMYQLIQNSEI